MTAKMAEVILFTTADAQGQRQAEVARLFQSVARFRAERPDIPVRHYFLAQRVAGLDQAMSLFAPPAWADMQSLPDRVPLSAARNILLDKAFDDGVADDAVVLFPDDDGWYSDGALEHVIDRMAERPALDFWFCRYGSSPALDVAATDYVPTYLTVVARGSSNTIVVRGSLLKRIGGFDGELGLGTPAQGGEDTEFAIRAFLAARETLHMPVVMVGHRDPDPRLRSKYFGGTLAAIGRYAHYSASARFAFVRKLAVGATLVARRKMPIRALRQAWIMVRADGARVRAAATTGRPSAIRMP